jgi:RND family efflux transporter MFP subunit
MKHIIRSLLALLLIAGIAGGFWYYRSHTATAASTTTSGTTYNQVVQVKQGSLNATVSVVGALEAVQSADLAFEHLSHTTQLTSLAIAAGNTVTTGQVLATVDPAPYQQALDQAQSDLAAAEKTLADLKEPATALEIAQADLNIAKTQYQLQKAQNTLDDLVNPDLLSLESAVADAQSALAKAQSNLLAQQQDQSYKDQLSRLVTAEATPQATYSRLAAETYSDEYYQDRLELAYNRLMDAKSTRVTYEVNREISILQAQMQLRKAEKTLADAQEALASAQAGNDPSTSAGLALAQAQVAVNEAQVSLQTAQAARTELLAGTDATVIATAQADVDKKRLAASDAAIALSGTKLVAPFDGTILKTNVTAGSQVAANTTILTIANLKTLQVAASVDETTIKQVSAGQIAVMTFDAFAGQTLTGTVQAVPLQGTLQGGVMVYDVPISLSNTGKLSLLVGMTANVKINVGKTGQTGTALLVPTVALQKANGLYQVLVPNTTDPQGDPVAVPVAVGLSDGTYTQITKGLNAGDQVIYQAAATATSSNIPGGGTSSLLRMFGGR